MLQAFVGGFMGLLCQLLAFPLFLVLLVAGAHPGVAVLGTIAFFVFGAYLRFLSRHTVRVR
jgi:hypothetical protein